ncbi:MAG: hypothetical protein Q7U50_05830, partial [Candidatus Nitrotoga sp.]|nr:hypothetical protein [Candidatus Nitrotoga sp.]
MREKKYASGISREKFAEIEPLLVSVRRRTKPTTVDLYEVFCAVLYVLRTGCHGPGCHGADCQAQRTAQVRGDPLST